MPLAPPSRSTLAAAIASAKSPKPPKPEPEEHKLELAIVASPAEVLTEPTDIAHADGLVPVNEIELKFNDLAKSAATALSRCAALDVTSSDDVQGMKLAREHRLSLRQLRVLVEGAHKTLKQGILERGRAIDSARRSIVDKLEHEEARLKELETFAEREAVRLEDEKRRNRAEEIRPFLEGGHPPVDLGKLPDDEWTQLFQNAKDLHKLREERKAAEAAKREQEAEEARLRAEEERREFERQRKELAEQKAKLERELKARAELIESRKQSLGDSAVFLVGCDLGTASDDEFTKAAADAMARNLDAKEQGRKQGVRAVRSAQVRDLGISRLLPERIVDLADPTPAEWQAIVDAASKSAEEERLRKEADELRLKQERAAQDEQKRLARIEEERLAAIAAAGDSAIITEYARLIAAVPLPDLSNKTMTAHICEQMSKVIHWLNQKAESMKEDLPK